MSHLSELELTLLLDSKADQAGTEHLAQCSHCQKQLAALTRENERLATTMAAEADAFAAEIAVPKFTPPASLTRFAMINVSTALVIWLAQFLWKTLFGELIMNAAATLTSVYVPDMYAAANATFLYYLQEGTAMLDAYLGLIVAGVFAITMVWLLISYRKSRALASLCLLIAVGGTLATPTPAQALEVRHEEDGIVTLSADETIDDTLLVAAETILIKGDITGDLVAAGRRIEVEGSVSGNLIAFGETVTLRGSVGGSVLTAASSVELIGTQVVGNLWAAARSVSVDRDSAIAQNTMASAQTAVLEGKLTKELYSFGELGGQLKAFGRRVRLLDSALVKGDAVLHLPHADLLQRSPGAQLLGSLDLQESNEHAEHSSRYSHGKFYLWQVARLISALLVGLVLVWCLPQYKYLSLSGGVEGLKTAGMGLLTLIGVPIAALIIAITLVGIPFSMITLLTWTLLIYLAKIVVGAYIGRSLLASTVYSDNSLLILLLGIGIIIVAINLPFLGSTINFLLTIVGTGLIVQQLFQAYAKRT